MNTKTCKVCGESKVIELFCKNNNGYYLSKCKKCDSIRRRKWDMDHPEKYAIQKAKINKKCAFNKMKRRKILTEEINKIKSKGCSYCGYNRFPECLHFHHLDLSDKDENISIMVRKTKNIEKILNEIKLCVLLCGNCHMALHNGDIKI